MIIGEKGPNAVDGPSTVTISPATAGTDDTLPSLSMSYTSTEYTPVHRGPLEGGHKDMLTGVVGMFHLRAISATSPRLVRMPPDVLSSALPEIATGKWEVMG